MKWSHSALKMFKNCPRQYYELRVRKSYPKDNTEKMLYGKELHAAAEAYIRDPHRPIDPRFAFLQPIINAMLTKKGRRRAELELAVTRDLVPCAWDSQHVWCMGIVDLAIVDGPLAWVVDWKTGNEKYPERDQLTLMSLLIFAFYPEVEVVNSALIYVLSNSVIKHKVRREEATGLWWKFREDVARIEAAFASGTWNPQQSGLCKRHCKVLSCELNGKYFDKPIEGG